MENNNTIFAAYNFAPVSYVPSPELYFTIIQQMTMQIYQQNMVISQLRIENEDLKALIRQS